MALGLGGDGVQALPEDSHAGVRVEVRPLLGRVLVAAKAFVPGETLLTEPPLLSPAMARPTDGRWPGLLNEYDRLPTDLRDAMLTLLAFAQADAATQDEIRQGFYAPREIGRKEDPELEKRASLAARGLKVGGVGVSHDDAITVLLAQRYNSFSYPMVTHDGATEDTSALFSLGSKCEHACRPVAVYKVDHASAPARFVAVADIEVGARISVGYVDCTMPRALRQRHCWERFSFECRCERCAGDPGAGSPAPPDGARSVPCWACDGMLQPCGADDGGVWRCTSGDSCPLSADGVHGCVMPDKVRDRLGLDDLEESLLVQEELASGGCMDAAAIEAQLEKLSVLGPRHWVVGALQRRLLGLRLQHPRPLPPGAGKAALAGLEAALENGGVGAAAQVAWEGIALAVAVRLCRAGDFAAASALATTCTPVLNLVYPTDSSLRCLAGRLGEACAAQDASLLDERAEGGDGHGPERGPRTLHRLVD